jgi:hypothetical protein
VIVTSNSEGRSIVSEAWVVGIACGGEGTHEPAKRENAIAIVAITFINDSFSCVYKISEKLICGKPRNKVPYPFYRRNNNLSRTCSMIVHNQVYRVQNGYWSMLGIFGKAFKRFQNITEALFSNQENISCEGKNNWYFFSIYSDRILD